MKSALNLIAELDEDTIRAVHSGDVSRDVLSNIGAEKGFADSAGRYAHRLIRAHENLEAFIAFYCDGVSHAMSGDEAPEIEGNRADITVRYPHGRPVRGLERLLRDHGEDPQDWEVQSFTANEWGQAQSEGNDVVYINLFQGKARMERKTRQPQYERVQPVSVEAPDPPDVQPLDLNRPRGWRTALIYGDPQYGFRWRPQGAGLIPLHDREAVDLLVQVASLVNPEVLVNLGDLFDFAPLKDLNDKPELKRALQPALCEAGYDQARLRAAAEPERHIVHEGNHDVRLQDKLLADLTEIYQLRDVEAQKNGGPPAASIPALLKMDEKGIEWSDPYKDDEVLLNDGLATMHGETAKSDSGDTTRYTLKYNVSDYSKIFGHIHRREWAWKTTWKGEQRRTIGAGSPGALCRVDGVVPAVRKRMNYQQGLMVVHFDPDGWQHTVNQVPIWPDTTDGPSECWFRGHRLQADPPSVETLSHKTGFDFT